MNTKVLSLALIGAALTFTACKKETTNQEEPVVEVTDSTTITMPPVDSTGVATDAPVVTESKTITVTGKVTEINKGKDGYTAKISSAEGPSYFATISIPNLADPKQYRSVKVGDNITVKGEPTNIEDDVLIKVTELQP